jgi:poly(A) polymerase
MAYSVRDYLYGSVRQLQPKILPAAQHEIDESLIDSDALFVMDKLREAGFIAYLVGGSVRDLLIKRVPKDFDISTSALPEQVKQLFSRRCILIGRRFRLAHVRFGHKIIEVSTFRSGDNDGDLILQDNEWGTPEQDVLRRDFTINGLFYDSSTHSLIDYVGGWEDIQKRVLRTIGNPMIRFKQDPVRMLRLLKFRARFAFEIDADARKALVQSRDEIIKSSPARLLEEIFRMLESGSSAPFFMMMAESGLLKLLFAPMHHFLLGRYGQEVFKYLSVIDKIHQNHPKNPIERPLLIACLLFPILETELQTQYLAKDKVPHLGDVMMLTSAILKAVLNASFSHFPRRISSTAGFILATQFRMTPLSGKRHPRLKLLHMKEFTLALKFLKIRALVNEKYQEDFQFWDNLYKQTTRHGERRLHPHPPPHSKTPYREKTQVKDTVHEL